MFALLALLSIDSGAASKVLITAPLTTNTKQTFLLTGSTFGGADFVHVWAFPSSGPIFLGQSPTTAPDAVTQLETGSFSVQAKNLPVGIYPIVVYVHNAGTNTFDTQVVTTYTVSACVMVAFCFPFTVGLSGGVENWYVTQCQ